MKGFLCFSIFVLLFLVLLPLFGHARNIGKLHPHHGHLPQPRYGGRDPMTKQEYYYRIGMKPRMNKRTDPVKVAGSSLPDCTHACGSCTPCRLVIVGFVCSSLEEAETCPMAYKCMCHNKSYPVP